MLVIAVGTVVVGVNPDRFDIVVITLPRDHGIHLAELIGAALVALGTTALLLLPRST